MVFHFNSIAFLPEQLLEFLLAPHSLLFYNFVKLARFYLSSPISKSTSFYASVSIIFFIHPTQHKKNVCKAQMAH